VVLPAPPFWEHTAIVFMWTGTLLSL
jgi:hypothetical protein